MKILAFAGSNSSTSINQQLIRCTVGFLPNSEVIQLMDYAAPIYSEDLERMEGIPSGIKKLHQKLDEADALVISVGEHNGNISAFFKNLLDWLSRHKRDFLLGKKTMLMAASPGRNGGSTALRIMEDTLPYFGAEVIGTLSVGNFYEVVKEGEITDSKLKGEIQDILKLLV